MPLWLETCRRLRELVGDEKAIMGRADQAPGRMINANAKPECIRAMVDAAREFGQWTRIKLIANIKYH